MKQVLPTHIKEKDKVPLIMISILTTVAERKRKGALLLMYKIYRIYNVKKRRYMSMTQKSIQQAAILLQHVPLFLHLNQTTRKTLRTV